MCLEHVDERQRDSILLPDLCPKRPSMARKRYSMPPSARQIALQGNIRCSAQLLLLLQQAE